MNTKELKSKLTVDNIIKIIESLGGTLHTKTNDYLIFDSLCHHITPSNHKPKLYYYIHTNSFFCYSCSSSFDIFSLIEARWNLLDKNFNFSNIVHYIGEISGIDVNVKSITPVAQKTNWHKLLSRYSYISATIQNNQPISKSILELFQPKYPLSWIQEGISIQSMEKYNIGFYDRLQQTTIPCYDEDNNLIGIRVRNWKDTDAKYNTLITLNNNDYKFNTNQILYGLNINKFAIEHYKKCILAEGEKSVLKGDTWFGSDNCTLSMFGSSLNNLRRDKIIQLGIETLIYSPDFDYKDINEFKRWFTKQQRLLSKFKGYCNIEILINKDNIVPYKDNAFDTTKENYLYIYKNRLQYDDWINYCQQMIERGEINE